MRRPLLLRCLCLLVLLSFATGRAMAEGEAVNGYPNWAERVLLEWMNRARSDPQADLAACPSGNCKESACYNTAAPPRHLDFNLEHSARFHGDHMRINGYTDHPSHCTLVSNIAALYPNTCSGAASCSCTQGALSSDQNSWTDPFTRMQLFGATLDSAGEIIAWNYSGPDASFYAWLYEPAQNANCGISENDDNGNGHRFLLLTPDYGPAAGAGYTSTGDYAVMDFAGTASNNYKIPSGSHYPQQAATVDAWANWYDTAAPSSAKINVDGVCSAMTLARGTSTNGAWHASVGGVGSGCHRYQFAFKDSGGNDVLYPSTGSLGIGGSATCPDWNAYAPPACGTSSGFVALTPARLLDTRAGYHTNDELFAGTGAIGAAGKLDLSVLGRGGVPGSGVVAVALNVTVTSPTSPGFVMVWPTGATQPNASNINFMPGDTKPNLVVVKVGTNGQVSLLNSAGNTHVIADVVGYFGAASNLTALNPARLLDTRPGYKTIDGTSQGIGALVSGARLDLNVGGRATIPGSGVGSAILNLTVTNPTVSGFLTAWPSDSSQPNASNLNFVQGLTTSNLVIGKVSSDGRIAIAHSPGTAGSTDVIADVMGWFPSSSELTSLVPARVLDTRPGYQTVDGNFAGVGAIQSGGVLDLIVLNRGGVPASGVGAVILNVTAVFPSAPAGFMTIWPSGVSLPNASNLNFVQGQIVPNLVIAKVGANGKVSIFNSAGATHVVADVVGWFKP